MGRIQLSKDAVLLSCSGTDVAFAPLDPSFTSTCRDASCPGRVVIPKAMRIPLHPLLRCPPTSPRTPLALQRAVLLRASLYQKRAAAKALAELSGLQPGEPIRVRSYSIPRVQPKTLIQHPGAGRLFSDGPSSAYPELAGLSEYDPKLGSEPPSNSPKNMIFLGVR